MSVRTSLFDPQSDSGSGVSRYDLLLAILPLPLLLGVTSASLSPIPLHYGVSLGSLPSVFLLAYGLFYDAPTGPKA